MMMRQKNSMNKFELYVYIMGMVNGLILGMIIMYNAHENKPNAKGKGKK